MDLMEKRFNLEQSLENLDYQAMSKLKYEAEIVNAYDKIKQADNITKKINLI